MAIKQLRKLGENFYPRTSTDAVIDESTGRKLSEILAGGVDTYSVSMSQLQGKEGYDKVSEAVANGKLIIVDGIIVMPELYGSELRNLMANVTIPGGAGLSISTITITWDEYYNVSVPEEQYVTANIELKSDGTKFLADDGTYKFVETNPFEIPSGGVLPETGKAGKIYLIPASETGDNNLMYEYVWINESWEKLGEFVPDVDLGGYYTKEEVDNKGFATTAQVDAKQDVISDLATIRTNAEKGATAEQNAKDYADGKVTSLKTELTKTLGNVQTAVTDLESTKLDVEIANTTLATKEEVSRKQNTLVSGTNIKTLNGENLLGLGDIIIDTSVLNSTGTHSGKAMSQKATTDVLNAEINRATTKENELEGRIFAHESITQDAYDTAEYAETVAIDSNERSQSAETTASAAMAAVRTLEGLGNTDTAQTTLANTVAQIEQNSSDIKVLQEMFVLISEEAYEALEVKDPTKIYLMYEE